jgi:hypothetical protein
LNLVSVVIKEMPNIRQACREAKVAPKQLYRWVKMGALIDRLGNIYRYQDGATVDRDGESVIGKVYVLIGKFTRELDK